MTFFFGVLMYSATSRVSPSLMSISAFASGEPSTFARITRWPGLTARGCESAAGGMSSPSTVTFTGTPAGALLILIFTVGMRGLISAASLSHSMRASADFLVSSDATGMRPTERNASRASISSLSSRCVLPSSMPVTGVCPSAWAAFNLSRAAGSCPFSRSSLPSLKS